MSELVKVLGLAVEAETPSAETRVATKLDELTIEQRHPDYGSCDGLGPRGACSECSRIGPSLDVNDFDDADYVDLTVDIRSGTSGVVADRDDDRPARLARGTEPSSPLMRVMLCESCRGERFVASYSPVAGVPGGFTSAEEPCRACEDHSVCSAQLHAALQVVADLLACIDTKAHMWQSQQDAVWRAKQLLEEHGKAVKR